MTEELFETKKKDFKKWARNDAKYYIIGKEKLVDRTINEHFNLCIAVYGKERLMTQFDYSEEQYNAIISLYNECFWQGFKYWEDRYNKVVESVLQRYNKIFKEAEEIAKKVDVSEIQDGFPCGGVHLYLNPDEKNTDLGKALALKNGDYDSIPYKYQLPIKMPSYGQCVDFDRKICEEVKNFLISKDVLCLTHSYID